MAKIISIINFKGGVGKTTTAVNLSASLTHQNYKVLLVDVDPQMSASGVLLNNIESVSKSNRTFPNMLATYLAGKKIITQRWVQRIATSDTDTRSGFMDLITGDHRTERLETSLFKKPYAVQKLLTSLFINDYDFILFDCPPSLNRLTLNTLTASDYFIVPTIPDFISMRGIETLFHKMQLHFNRLTAKQHKSPELIGILLNRVSYQRRKIQDSIEQEIRYNIASEKLEIHKYDVKKDYIFNQQISDRIDIPRSAQMRRSLYDYDQTCNGATEFIAMANELLERISIWEQIH